MATSQAGSHHVYEPPVSLWKLVSAHIPESEWPEVKIMLGESLVQQSIELHEEVKNIYSIYFL